VPTYALRYDVGDEQQVKIRCGQLIATQYGQLGVVFERHRNGLFELYSTDREIMRKVWYATRGLVKGSAVEG
jgi:hypothetical protein